MMQVRSFSSAYPCGNASSRTYKYHDGADPMLPAVSDVWSWLLSNRKCSRVLLSNDNGSLCSQNQHKVASNEMEATHSSDNRVHISVAAMSDLSATRFGSFGCTTNDEIIRKDTEGRSWKITVEKAEETESNLLLYTRVYKVHLLSNSSGSRDGEKEKEAQAADRFVSVTAVDTPWSGSNYPTIAQFKKQVKELYL